MNDEDLKIVSIDATSEQMFQAVYKFPKWMTDQQIIEYFIEEGSNGEFEEKENTWQWGDVRELDEIDADYHSVWTPNFELIEKKFGKPTEEELEEQAEHKLQNMSIDEFQNCLEDINGTASSVFDEYYNEVKEAIVKQLAERY
tara:strand:- start:802 stop:1230 length:429 start_codon:yes stop_codon:yes gene_type:complete